MYRQLNGGQYLLYGIQVGHSAHGADDSIEMLELL